MLANQQILRISVGLNFLYVMVSNFKKNKYNSISKCNSHANMYSLVFETYIVCYKWSIHFEITILG